MGSIRDTVKCVVFALFLIGLTSCGKGGGASSISAPMSDPFDLDPSDLNPVPSSAPNPSATPSSAPSANPTPTPSPAHSPNPSTTPNPTPTPSPAPPVGGNGPCALAPSTLLANLCLLVNQERAKVGATPLNLTAPLNGVAQAFADDMYQNHFFSHTGLDGRSPFDRMRDAGISFGYAGENIAMGATTAEQVMSMWMNSSGHRANILNPSFHKLGLGLSHTYWVQNFTD